MGKGGSQRSQAESSVKRLIRRLRKKDKSPTVEPKKPVESPQPAATPPVAADASVASVAKSRRRRRTRSRRDDEWGEGFDRDKEPVIPLPRSWHSHGVWSDEAKAVAEAFFNRYAEMGIEGIKEEFKKEIEGYKSPDYADTMWKANPTKNRDKDQMTCLDGSRYEFRDKKKYINASWVYDTQLVERKYILAQEPIVPFHMILPSFPNPKENHSTLEEFWEMVRLESCIFVLKFNQVPVIDCKGKGTYTEYMDGSFYPRENIRALPIGNLWLESKTAERQSINILIHPHHTYVTPRACPVEENHKHKKTIVQVQEGCSNLAHHVRIFHDKGPSWSMLKIRDLLLSLRQLEYNSNAEKSPIVLVDDHSGTSRAAMFVAIDVLGTLLYHHHKDVTLASIVKWIRRCRNGAIRDADEYVFIMKVLMGIILRKFGRNKPEKVAALYNEMTNVDENKKKEEENKKKEEEAIRKKENDAKNEQEEIKK